jgi:hypothetical protein
MKLGYWVEGNWEPLAVLGTALPRVEACEYSRQTRPRWD